MWAAGSVGSAPRAGGGLGLKKRASGGKVAAAGTLGVGLKRVPGTTMPLALAIEVASGADASAIGELLFEAADGEVDGVAPAPARNE